jgi:hypothetical protein
MSLVSFLKYIGSNLDKYNDKASFNELIVLIKKEYPITAKCQTASSCLLKILSTELKPLSETLNFDKCSKLFILINLILRKVNPNNSTYSSSTTHIHNFLKLSSPEIYLLSKKLCTLSRDEYNDLNNQRDKSLLLSNEHVLTFKQSEINKILKRTYASNALYDIIVYLMLTCGRRLIEILTGEFTPCHDDEHFVMFKGKVKGALLRDKDLLYKIPIIVSQEMFLEKAFEFKELYPDVGSVINDSIVSNNSKITHKYDSRINNYLRKLFPSSKVKTHTLRKIYGVLAFNKFSPLDTYKDYSFNAFLKEVLLHQSITTSLNYTNVKII